MHCVTTCAARAATIYDADAVDKSVEDLAIALARGGEPFASVVPQVERHADRRMIDISYRIEQGKRIYIERIQIHGNTKTRDEVIRREFDVGEGDAYNRALVDRGERHLKALGYFKSVKIAAEPGSAPDRVVLDVAVEEQQTGNFFISGGYSTSDGFLGEVTISDTNFLGTGNIAKASVTYGQYARGFDLAFTDPWFLGQRLAVGTELFGRQTFANSNQAFNTSLYGAKFSAGTPITDNLGVNWNYSIYNQGVSLDPAIGTVSLPIQQAAQAGCLLGILGRQWRDLQRRSTIRKIRRPAFGRGPTTNSPGSAARPNLREPPKMSASIIRSSAIWSAWCARKAAMSRHGAASNCRC